MNILALDLGTTTGFAYSYANVTPRVSSRTWATAQELKDQKARRGDRRGDIRVVRFYDWLTDLHAQCKFDAVVFEDVLFASSTYQVQLWSAFRTTVWLAFPKALIEAVPVQTLKKHATGSGAADKQTMAAALKARHPEIYRADLDDNAVDAASLWLWATQNLGRIKV